MENLRLKKINHCAEAKISICSSKEKIYFITHWANSKW
jgi:hypothetical protein